MKITKQLLLEEDKQKGKGMFHSLVTTKVSSLRFTDLRSSNKWFMNQKQSCKLYKSFTKWYQTESSHYNRIPRFPLVFIAHCSGMLTVTKNILTTPN